MLRCFLQAETELHFSKYSDCYLHLGKRFLNYQRSIPSRGQMCFVMHGNLLRSYAIHIGDLYLFSVST